ncbi:glycosyltransferase family 4 protein [Candidatus Woesearchaeota archaeon]|nr:glycosyltransferase family 4 protein [Candidatus Woesearchaeota archaeon]
MNFVIALSQKVPTAVTLHEVHYNSEDLREKIIKKIEEIIIKKANKIIVHTEGHRKFILEKYKKNAEVAYMGVTLHDMHKRKNNSLLLFGIISPNKGAEYLIEAMQELPEYELTIAGSAVDKEYYKKLIELVGKSKAKIKMETGWISEQRKKELFTNCDMLVLPYIKAPYQSAVLHDAISYGLPIVATRTGGVYEIVEQFKCGEVAEPKSKESLAAAIKKTSSEYEKYQKGIAGYREEANWDRVAARHIEVYRKLTKMCLNHAA